LVVWHKGGRKIGEDTSKNLVVVDGNHRVSAITYLLHHCKRSDNEIRFRYVNVVIMDPRTDIRTLEKIGKGMYTHAILC